MATMNFEMFEGDTHKVRATVRTPAGVVVNITDVDILWWMAKNAKVPLEDVLVQKETGAGITIIDGPNGIFEVTLDPPDTEGYGGKTYYHEAEIDDGGVISTVLVGSAKIKLTLIP